MSALSELLNEARGDRTVRAVGRGVGAYGVGESTIIPYFNGSHGRPSVRVLAALAQVLDVDEQALRAAAGLPMGERERYVAPPEADLLNRRQRDALDELIRSFVASMTTQTDEGRP